jgi:hypothetical protein
MSDAADDLIRNHIIVREAEVLAQKILEDARVGAQKRLDDARAIAQQIVDAGKQEFADINGKIETSRKTITEPSKT